MEIGGTENCSELLLFKIKKQDSLQKISCAHSSKLAGNIQYDYIRLYVVLDNSLEDRAQNHYTGRCDLDGNC